MELHKLKAFYTVAKLESFSKAAEVLFLTQPAVSTQIKDLEYDLKTKLFDRIGRRIQLTQAGEILLPYVKNILDLLAESYSAVDLLKKTGEGAIQLGVSELPAARLIPSRIASFLIKYPNVNFSITAKKSSVIINLIKANKLDMGIIGASTPELTTLDIEGTMIYKDEIVVAMSNHHPLADKDTISVSDLSNQPVIVSLKNTVSRQAIDKLFNRLNIPYKIAFEIDNKEMIKALVEKNLGIAFFSYLEIKNEAESGWIKTLPISDYPFYRYIHVIHHQNKQLSSSQKAFFDFLLEKREINER